MKSVSVILPVKDEPYAKHLEYKIHKYLKGFQCEVLFQHEEGISNAVLAGINQAKGDLIAIMDSDGAHSPFDLLMMVNYLEKSPNADIIVGQRTINYYPVHRKILSLLCAWLTRNFLNLNLDDPLTAFIVGKREVMGFKPMQGCKFALEIIAKIPRTHIATWPTIHRKREGHKSKLKPLEGIYLFKQLLRLKNG